MADWSVYIIECCDGSLYTGITTDVERRFRQHRAGTGAKYFRAKQPVRIVYTETEHDRATASRREAEIKRMGRAEKLAILQAAR
ncbi:MULTISPECIES: GIY-YIG nuclease family protein [Methylomonas]|uniref:GIY-YIG nuclease family protein n=1 Tax=Methylomonas TaxID=416 RepID=UPI0007C8E309|nr:MULTISPECIES: GIY-YIG nuclease family protein [Methylomonas]ANE56264.1 endonuclease [Methylomonas sp. DH-1]ATG91179.1 endonuclease [Methylomonas koyamae]WNB77280.1 GIY-YIG nuclease family protein [Methylomonas koyamae]